MAAAHVVCAGCVAAARAAASVGVAAAAVTVTVLQNPTTITSMAQIRSTIIMEAWRLKIV